MIRVQSPLPPYQTNPLRERGKNQRAPPSLYRCHFETAWQWKPIHNWSRDGLNLEPGASSCSALPPPTQLELCSSSSSSVAMQLQQRKGGVGGWGAACRKKKKKWAVLQIFRGHHTTRLPGGSLKGGSSGVTSRGLNSAPRHVSPQNFFFMIPGGWDKRFTSGRCVENWGRCLLWCHTVCCVRWTGGWTDSLWFAA